jgi:glycosyltransferase involved in cell wall biosynthesis
VAHGRQQSDSMTTVSAIIPTFNGEAFIARAIESALTQTTPPNEIVVIDDASTDRTADLVAARFPRLRLLRLECNVGSGAARNAGIAASTGEIVAFLDHDDAWQAGYVAAQIKAMGTDREIVLSRTALTAVDSATGERMHVGVAALKSRESAIEQLLIGRNPFVTLSIIAVRRAALDRVGWFDPSLRLLNDRDLYLKLIDAGRFAGVATALCTKYQHDANQLYEKGGKTWLTEQLVIIDRFFADPANAGFRPLEATARRQARERVASAMAGRRTAVQQNRK